MGLNYKLRRAVAIIGELTPDEALTLDRHCHALYRAETRLLSRAEALMDRCLGGCRGLCCRNAAFDDIIALPDLVYVLRRAPHLVDRMARGLADEKPFFTGNCPFLAGGQGPCIFPDAVRPEVCITTFCADTAPVRREIVQVKRAFVRLGWFLWWRGVKGLMRHARGCRKVKFFQSRS